MQKKHFQLQRPAEEISPYNSQPISLGSGQPSEHKARLGHILYGWAQCFGGCEGEGKGRSAWEPIEFFSLLPLFS